MEGKAGWMDGIFTESRKNGNTVLWESGERKAWDFTGRYGSVVAVRFLRDGGE